VEINRSIYQTNSSSFKLYLRHYSWSCPQKELFRWWSLLFCAM